MQYVLTLQDHHQVSIIIKILRKNLNSYDFFKIFIHPHKECDLILTMNFVVTYNFIEVFLQLVMPNDSLEKPKHVVYVILHNCKSEL